MLIRDECVKCDSYHKYDQPSGIYHWCKHPVWEGKKLLLKGQSGMPELQDYNGNDAKHPEWCPKLQSI